MSEVGVTMHLCLSTTQRRTKLRMEATLHEFLTSAFDGAEW
jgi:hypothetical protein